MLEFTLFSHLTHYSSCPVDSNFSQSERLAPLGERSAAEEPLWTSRPPLAHSVAAFPLFSGVALWSVKGADVFGEYQSYPSGQQSQLKALYEG